jgi:Ni,Fe-hydrogenase I large subunit
MYIYLNQDVNGVQGKMSAMQEDQRLLRCHWLAEKNDLETRCFQAQGLATQYQGTIRKKDKDYEKLQTQLAKMVKDSQRGQKAVAVITRPLPKNFQETAKTVVTLKDVELAESRSTNAAIEVRNINK